jgi:hypothetical protein
MRYASAKGLEMNAPSNNNLPTLTNDVIVNLRNPENPDSERQAAACEGKCTSGLLFA